MTKKTDPTEPTQIAVSDLRASHLGRTVTVQLLNTQTIVMMLGSIEAHRNEDADVIVLRPLGGNGAGASLSLPTEFQVILQPEESDDADA